MKMLTQLCVQQPIEGKHKGLCCICGCETDKGHKPSFSDNFTGYSFLTHGNCMCPYCYSFFKDQNFRRKSWLATIEKVRFLQRLECREVILNPPSPPFFIYITQTGQRQGWLSAMRFINHNQKRFYISTDWVGHFLADRDEAQKMHMMISELRAKGINKTALRTGEYTMKQVRTAIENGWHEILLNAKKQVKNPLWEVMLYVAE